MNIGITPFPDDDSLFLQGLTRLVSEAIRQYDLPEVFLIRTDNWFDVKWFGFAGKAKVGIDTGIDAVSSEVRPFWETPGDVTFPPFAPNRIVEQLHMKYANGDLTPAGEEARLVHPLQRQRSSDNLGNRVLDFCSSGLFIWFSSKSAINGRASLMLYRTNQGKLTGWYASFTGAKQWHVDRVRNKDRDLIERLFQRKTKEGTTQHL